MKCPGCGQGYGAKASQAGRTLSCRKCGASIEVPDPSVAAFASVVVDEEDAPPVVAVTAKPRPVASPPPAEEPEDEPRPWFYTAGIASAWILLGLAMIGAVGWLAILATTGQFVIFQLVYALIVGLAAVAGCATVFMLADAGLSLRAIRREIERGR